MQPLSGYKWKKLNMKSKLRISVTFVLVVIICILKSSQYANAEPIPDEFFDHIMEDAELGMEKSSMELMWEAEFHGRPYVTKAPKISVEVEPLFEIVEPRQKEGWEATTEQTTGSTTESDGEKEPSGGEPTSEKPDGEGTEAIKTESGEREQTTPSESNASGEQTKAPDVSGEAINKKEEAGSKEVITNGQEIEEKTKEVEEGKEDEEHNSKTTTTETTTEPWWSKLKGSGEDPVSEEVVRTHKTITHAPMSTTSTMRTTSEKAATTTEKAVTTTEKATTTTTKSPTTTAKTTTTTEKALKTKAPTTTTTTKKPTTTKPTTTKPTPKITTTTKKPTTKVTTKPPKSPSLKSSNHKQLQEETTTSRPSQMKRRKKKRKKTKTHKPEASEDSETPNRAINTSVEYSYEEEIVTLPDSLVQDPDHRSVESNWYSLWNNGATTLPTPSEAITVFAKYRPITKKKLAQKKNSKTTTESPNESTEKPTKRSGKGGKSKKSSKKTVSSNEDEEEPKTTKKPSKSASNRKTKPEESGESSKKKKSTSKPSTAKPRTKLTTPQGDSIQGMIPDIEGAEADKWSQLADGKKTTTVKPSSKENTSAETEEPLTISPIKKLKKHKYQTLPPKTRNKGAAPAVEANMLALPAPFDKLAPTNVKGFMQGLNSVFGFLSS